LVLPALCPKSDAAIVQRSLACLPEIGRELCRECIYQQVIESPQQAVTYPDQEKNSMSQRQISSGIKMAKALPREIIEEKVETENDDQRRY